MLRTLLGLLGIPLIAVWLSGCGGAGATAQRITVETDGMAPTITAGERVAFDPDAFSDGRSPAVGDIVLFTPTRAARLTCGSPDPAAPFVKRVVGVAGDRVQVRADGRVTRNGDVLEVPGAPRANYRMRFPVVPTGAVLVLGDNRPASCDSHQWRDRAGNPAPFVPVGNVTGRVELPSAR